MAGLDIIYGNALLNLSKNDDLNELVSQAEEILIDVLNDDVYNFLIAPNVSKNEKYSYIETKFGHMKNETLLNTIKLMIQKNDTAYIQNMLGYFVESANKKLGRIIAYVTSAKELNNEEKISIKKILEKKTDLQYDVIYNIDSDLIGGFYIIIEGQIFDSSIRGKLNNLKRYLKGGETWLKKDLQK